MMKRCCCRRNHGDWASAGDVTSAAANDRCPSPDTLNAAIDSIIISHTHTHTHNAVRGYNAARTCRFDVRGKLY